MSLVSSVFHMLVCCLLCRFFVNVMGGYNAKWFFSYFSTAFLAGYLIYLIDK